MSSKQVAPKLDPLHKSLVDDWLTDPAQNIIKLVQKYFPKAKTHVGGCTQRLNNILKRPEMVVYREERAKELQAVANIKQDEAVKFLAGTLRANLADFLYQDANGNVQVKDLTEIPRELTAQIRKIKVKTHNNTYKNGDEVVTVVTELELYDKLGAIDRLAKLLKWVEQGNTINTFMGVLVIPEGSSKEEQWNDYQKLPDGSEFIPADKTNV